MNPGPTPSRFQRAVFKGGVVLLLLVALYALAFQRSIRQVDAFCARVSTDTDVSALPLIAKAAGVRLHGPSVVDNKGASSVFATVVSAMTMGDYGCDIHASSMTGKVEVKQLGYR